MSSSTARTSEPSTPTTPRSFQNFVHGLRFTNRRAGNAPEGRDSSGSHRSLPGFLPVLPNPFGHVHPALRSPTRSQNSALPSPAPTAGRFSAMGGNPFLPRSSFFTRRAEAPTVLDYGGNVPIGMASSRFVDDDDETEMTTMNSLQRRWPSSRPPRRRRRQKKRSSKKSSVPILFPAMQSQRVRAKMLHSIIYASIIVLLVIACSFDLYTGFTKLTICRLYACQNKRQYQQFPGHFCIDLYTSSYRLVTFPGFLFPTCPQVECTAAPAWRPRKHICSERSSYPGYLSQGRRDWY